MDVQATHERGATTRMTAGDRALFLYDLWAADVGGYDARSEVEKKQIGEAIFHALFEPTQECAAILKRLHRIGGLPVDQMADQYGKAAARRVRYLCDVYLLTERGGRYVVTEFYTHLLSIRQRLAAVQSLASF
jgi:hypothetical protein